MTKTYDKSFLLYLRQNNLPDEKMYKRRKGVVYKINFMSPKRF